MSAVGIVLLIWAYMAAGVALMAVCAWVSDWFERNHE